jgi:hypothetical protein
VPGFQGTLIPIAADSHGTGSEGSPEFVVDRSHGVALTDVGRQLLTGAEITAECGNYEMWLKQLPGAIDAAPPVVTART